MQLLIMLLLIVCLASLGSFSLAAYLLPGMVPSSGSATGAKSGHTTPTPASSASVQATAAPTPTPITGPFIESECTARPQDMKYLPSTQSQTSTSSNNSTAGSTFSAAAATPSPSATLPTKKPSPTTTLPPTATPLPTATLPLPAAWTQAGRSQEDFANVQACAAAFTITYQTFDSDHIKTLEACTYMFTDGATQRFYGRPPNPQPDKHMDPMWRASLQKQHYQQAAQAAPPSLLAAKTVNGRFLAWMLVPYRSSVQIDTGQPIVQDEQITVLLIGVPINTQKTGTGWQVSQWQDGSNQFAPPNPL